MNIWAFGTDVFELLERARVEPERLLEGRIDLTPVVVSDEADGVHVVGEPISHMRVAHVEMAGR